MKTDFWKKTFNIGKRRCTKFQWGSQKEAFYFTKPKKM